MPDVAILPGCAVDPCYVAAALGGHRKPGRQSRLRAIATGLTLVALASSLAACGGGSSADSNEKAGTYQVKVTAAQFPTKQRLGQTSLLQIGIRNTGKKIVPAIAVTLSIAGKAGRPHRCPSPSTIPSPNSPSPTDPSGSSPKAFPSLLAQKDPAAAPPRTTRPLISARSSRAPAWKESGS